MLVPDLMIGELCSVPIASIRLRYHQSTLAFARIIVNDEMLRAMDPTQTTIAFLSLPSLRSILGLRGHVSFIVMKV